MHRIGQFQQTRLLSAYYSQRVDWYRVARFLLFIQVIWLCRWVQSQTVQWTENLAITLALIKTTEHKFSYTANTKIQICHKIGMVSTTTTLNKNLSLDGVLKTIFNYLSYPWRKPNNTLTTGTVKHFKKSFSTISNVQFDNPVLP